MTIRPFDRRALGHKDLDGFPFPRSLCDTLFAAVLVDDEVDLDLRLPDAVQLDYDQDTLVSCFWLCRQLWSEGFDRDVLLTLVGNLLSEHDLDDEDRLRFKHIRAKFKHFRYAHALYGVDHRYPRTLDWVTIAMGKVQDAYRSGRRAAVFGRASLLRMLLTGPVTRRVYSEGDRLVPTSPAGFRALLEADYAKLEALLARPTVTGHVFHATRKIVGRQVSFWDTLRTLETTKDRYRMSRWLSAINGSMGALHDQLVERRAIDAASYEAPFAIPDDIRERIGALLQLVNAQPTGARSI